MSNEDKAAQKVLYRMATVTTSERDLKRALSDVQNALAINPKAIKYQRFAAYLKSELAAKNKQGN